MANTPLDEALVPAVIEMIDEFGVSATFEERVDEVYDPSQSEKTESGTVNRTTLISPPQPAKNKAGYEATTVKVTDEFISYTKPASELDFTPTEGQKVTISPNSWRITAVEPLWSGELLASYRLTLKSGV